MTVAFPISNLWAATARVAQPDCPILTEDLEADVAVIGGGFTGLSTALHLSESGVDVCLVEAEEIGHGASGRNGGQLNPGIKLGLDALLQRFGEAGRGLFNLGEEAVDFVADLVSRHCLRCNFVRPGLIRLAHSPTAMTALVEVHDLLRARGIAAEVLTARDVELLTGTRRYIGGLLDPRGGSLHPLEFARELALVAIKAGARLYSKTKAIALEQQGGRWVVRCTGGSVRAEKVIIATNGYTDGLVPNLARSVLPVNSFQIATEPIGEDLNRLILPQGHAVYDSRRLLLYFRKSPDGRVMLGGRASFSSRGTGVRSAADYAILERVLRELFPPLEEIGISHRWTGLVCITPDFLPHYHEPAPGIHIVLGFNGRGVALATRTGAWLANTLLGRQDSGGIPKTEIKPIPFHGWRSPVLNALMKWNSYMDWLGR